jgi:hypothetical protein
MAQLDGKNRDFYYSLTDEEKKKFGLYLMIRWSSAVGGTRELQEYYVQSCNHYLNKHFFTVNRHPQLQWLMATSVSPGLGNFRHNWIAPRKKEPGAGSMRKQLADLFPHLKDDEVDLLAQITTKKEIDIYLRELGQEKTK